MHSHNEQMAASPGPSINDAATGANPMFTLPTDAAGTTDIIVPEHCRGKMCIFKSIGGAAYVKFGTASEAIGAVNEAAVSTVPGGVPTIAGGEPHVRMPNAGDEAHMFITRDLTKFRYKTAAATQLQFGVWTAPP